MSSSREAFSTFGRWKRDRPLLHFLMLEFISDREPIGIGPYGRITAVVGNPFSFKITFTTEDEEVTNLDLGEALFEIWRGEEREKSPVGARRGSIACVLQVDFVDGRRCWFVEEGEGS